MNALARTAFSAVPRAATRTTGRRGFNAGTLVTEKEIPMGGTKVWLSDVGAYPVIAILGIAVTGCSAYIAHHFFTCPDVRADRTKRQSIIRTWDR